jgi:hypothetical protein
VLTTDFPFPLGLHYHDQAEFESSMEDVFMQMDNFNRRPGANCSAKPTKLALALFATSHLCASVGDVARGAKS